jgi:hypothetical protein
MISEWLQGMPEKALEFDASTEAIGIHQTPDASVSPYLGSSECLTRGEAIEQSSISPATQDRR